MKTFLREISISLLCALVLGFICCCVYPLAVFAVGQAIFHAKANGSLVKKDGAYTSSDDQAVGSSLLGQNFSAPRYFHPRPSAAGAGYDAANSSGSNLGPLSDKLINGVTTPATTQPTTQAESLSFDGIRLRTIHYAVDNGLSFKLYLVKPDSSRTEVPLKNYQDDQGNLNDIALVDAFPHPPSDAPDRIVLIAADFGTPIPGDAVTASGSGLDPHISPRNAELQKQRIADARKITPEQVQQLIDQHTDRPDLGVLGDPGVNVLMLNLALDTKFPMPAPSPAK